MTDTTRTCDVYRYYWLSPLLHSSYVVVVCGFHLDKASMAVREALVALKSDHLPVDVYFAKRVG